MNKPIRMRFFEPGEMQFLPTKAWTVEPKTWLQRACWWLLNRQKCCHPFFEQRAMMTEALIDPDKVTRNLIMEAADRIAASGTNPVKILLGPEDLRRLMEDPAALPHMGYSDFSVVED